MRALKVLFAVFFVVAVASTAMGTTVQLSGAVSGSYTLNSITVNNDTITISVGSGGGACTPAASISPLTIPVYVTQGSSAPAQTVSIKDNCSGTNLPYNASVTSGTFISVPVSGTGPMPVTLNTASLAAGTYTGTISVTPGGYAAQTITVSLTVSSSVGGGGVGPAKTQIAAGQQVKDTISATGEKDYYFTLGASSAKISVYMSTMDWSTNQDMYVSNSAQPTCSGTQVSPVWSNVNPDNNETVRVYFIPFTAGTTFYVTVCNMSSVSGSYKLYWSAY